MIAPNTWNFTTNMTRPKSYDFAIFNITTLPIFIIFAIISWLVNITMLITIFIDRLHCLKKTSGSFVASINIASMILATSVILFAMQYIPETRVNDPWYWSVLLFLISAPVTCTFLFIVVISLERLFLVVKPLRYKCFMTEKKASSITAIIWVLTIVVAGLLLWLYRYHSRIYRYCSYSLFGLIVFVILVNVLTFYKLKMVNNALARIADSAVQCRTQARLKIETRFAQVMLLLLVNFLLFACPMLIIDGLIQMDMSCGGCLHIAKLPIGKLYFAGLLSLQLHAINSASFYLILIPKYRQSFVVTCKALVTFLSTD